MATALNITITGVPSIEASSAAGVIVKKLQTRVDETENIFYGDSEGSLPEITDLQITAAATAAGEAILTLNGVVFNVPLTISDINTNAAEINTFINASIAGYSSTVVTDTVTITAELGGAQANTLYAAGTATSSAGTPTTTQEGVTGTPYQATSTAVDPFKLFFFDVLKEGLKYDLTFVKVAPNAEV